MDDFGLDIKDLAAGFAAEMGGPQDPPEDPPNLAPAPPPPAPPPPGPSLDEFPMPKSWKAEHTPLWDKVNDYNTRKYIAQREAEMSQGIQMYQGNHSNWTKVLEPFQPVLAKHPQFDANAQVQLLQNLMHSHLRLLGLQGPEKVEFLKTLLKAYNVDMGSLGGAPGAPPPPPVIPPEFQQKVTGLESTLQTLVNERTQASVEAFFADPKNEFAAELAPDITQLLKEGAARDLPSAYKIALWQNEAVRKKLIDRELEARTRATSDEAKKAEDLRKGNRGSSDGGTPPKGKKQTVDETVDGVLEKYGKAH